MEIECGKYKFVGANANNSVYYFNKVLSMNHSVDIDYLAWDAAHKFGTQMVSDNLASFRDGITIGVNALDAAIYLDNYRKEEYAKLPEFGRKNAINALMKDAYVKVEKEYDVEVKLL